MGSWLNGTLETLPSWSLDIPHWVIPYLGSNGVVLFLILVAYVAFKHLQVLMYLPRNVCPNCRHLWDSRSERERFVYRDGYGYQPRREHDGPDAPPPRYR